MEKARFNSRAMIPIVTAIVAAVFIGVGLKDFGFWEGQPTAAFFPIIIAVVLLATSLLCLVQVISAPLAWMANRWILTPLSFRAAVRPLVLVLCSAAALGIVIVVCSALRRPSTSRVAQLLPMATFNCAVIGCLLVTTIQNFTLVQTLGFAVGSGAGYTLAVLAVTEGQRKLQARAVPAVFRGLPVTLLYIGILALAIYGFTGHTAAF